MKTCWGVEVHLHVFLTSALYAGELLTSRSGLLPPGIHRIGGLVGPRAGLDAVTWFD